MRFDARRVVFAGFLMFILSLSVTATEADEPGFQVESANLIVYRDGLVHVAQRVVVNETFPAIALPLLSSSVDNVIVLDENQTALDYEIDGYNMTVFTLGAKNVSLEYDTVSLTVKEAGVWTLVVDNPYNLTVFLPEESTVIYLSEMPTSIDTEGNKITLALFPGYWEISYVLPLSPPAKFQVSDIEVTPSEVETGGDVTISVRLTNVGGQAGSYTLHLRINQTTEDTKTVTLKAGESTTIEFKVKKLEPGTYTAEIAGLTAEFTVKELSSNLIAVEYQVAAAVAAVAAVFFAAFLIVRRRGPNVEKIFKAHPHLREEDRDVIRFLAEKGGKAFEAEIRERFPDIPRTSLWRLVRRLEKLEIVKVKRVGLENQVELKK